VASIPALAFLLANVWFRGALLVSFGGTGSLLLAAVAAAALVCLLRPAWLGPALTIFGSSFFLFGFHSYRVQNQAFELVVSALALVLLLAEFRQTRPPTPTNGAVPTGRSATGRTWLSLLWLLYALQALLSLLLLPPTVLAERAFLEGHALFDAVLKAFPQDPLYPFAALDRLALFVAFTVLLSRRADARTLYRALFRGIAWAAIATVVLGLLDFFGVISLAGYNLSHLFYGARYRRLQSTFGNPSWFACFVCCALPFVLLELWEARRGLRAVLAAFVPLCVASLFLSGARAAWLGCLVLAASLIVLQTALRRRGAPLPSLGPAARIAAAVTVAGSLVAAVIVYFPASPPTPASSTARLPGLARELRIRGSGVNSPRAVTARYGLALASEAPALGLGYETFSMHLGAQLAVPSSPVARVVNAAAATGERYFDDAHNTYLQILVGTGAAGLALWLALAAVGLLLVTLALGGESTPLSACVLLAMVVFHFYGLFQGMQYVAVTWFLFHLSLGYAMTVELEPSAARHGLLGRAFLVLLVLVAASATGYLRDRGYRAIKERYGLAAYLPDEAAEFVGFYRPEQGPDGEFRWTAERGVVHVFRARPFRLRIACEHTDLEREPVRLSFRFDGQDAGSIVFQRPGAVEKRFDFGRPGTLRLEVSRTFRPSTGDRRELGVAVSALRWE
jgi:O-antigen ligase